MSNGRGTYNRRNWTQRWKERVLSSAEEKQEKLARRYNIGSGWRRLLKQEPVVSTNTEQLIRATPEQKTESKTGIKKLFGLVKKKLNK